MDSSTSQPPTAENALPLKSSSTGTETSTPVTQSSSASSTVRLLCPICNVRNGKWTINFQLVYESGVHIFKRKRCRECRCRILYRAARGENGVAVNSLLDTRAKKDIAALFKVSLKDVEDTINEVQGSLGNKDAEGNTDLLPVREPS